MNASPNNIHALITFTIKNLNLDLTSELNDYEASLNQNQPFLAPSTNNNQPQGWALVQKEPDNSLTEENITPQEIKEDPIPVASRIVPQQQKLGDILFTPWGIFGLIIFIATNAIILIKPDFSALNEQNISSVDNINSPPQNNNIPEENINLTNLDLTNDLITIINQSNSANQDLIPAPSPPELNLDTIKQNSSKQETRENPNLYPNLETALLSEAILQLAKSGISVTPKAEQNQPKYHLITNYENPEQFSTIKQSIPSALVTKINEEIKIQLQSFTDKNEAEKQKESWQNLSLNITIIYQ